jgi:hypothetical protein
VDPAAVLGRHGLLLGPVLGWLAGVTGVPAAATARAVVVAAAVPLLGVALAGSLRARRRGDRRGAVAVAALTAGLAGLAVAVLAPRIALARAATGPVRTWGGAGLSLAELGILIAALCGLTGAAGRLRRRSLGPRHVLAVGLGALLVLAPAGYVLLWAWQGWDGGHRVVRADPDVLPAVTTVEAEGPAATRTLVVREGPAGLRWNLLRASGPLLGDSSAALAARAGVGTGGGADQAEVLPVLGAMLSDSGSDVRAQLEDLDVGSVLLLPPLGEGSVNALDASPGLVRVGTPEGAVLWRVELTHAGVATSSRPARVRVLRADGETLQALPSAGASRTDVDTRLQPGPAGRVLVLAERSDAGWRAWLDGRELVPARHGGWAQAFLLPAAGGHLVVEHRGPAQRALDLTRATVLAVALLLALPLPRRRRRLLAAHLPPASPGSAASGKVRR